MQSKRRNGRTSTTTSVEDEIAHLRGLDLKGLRSRWQTVFQRSAPAHLTRYLLFAVIAYRIQVDRYGDLDHATRQVLERTDSREARPAMSARLASFDQNVWSDRALQVDFAELAVSDLASMYPASGWSSLGSGPSWKPARLRSH